MLFICLIAELMNYNYYYYCKKQQNIYTSY